jgi:hypothetical protein
MSGKLKESEKINQGKKLNVSRSALPAVDLWSDSHQLSNQSSLATIESMAVVSSRWPTDNVSSTTEPVRLTQHKKSSIRFDTFG